MEDISQTRHQLDPVRSEREEKDYILFPSTKYIKFCFEVLIELQLQRDNFLGDFYGFHGSDINKKQTQQNCFYLRHNSINSVRETQWFHLPLSI